MPELPEVETIARGLKKILPSKTIISVNFDWPKGFPNSRADIKHFLINAKVISIKRRAKVLIINLNTKYSLVIHLKMTGQLVFVDDKNRWGGGHPNDSLINTLPDKTTRVVFKFSDGSNLFFNDQRKFGWVRLVPTVEVSSIDFFKKVGPEPLSSDFKSKEFISRIRKRPGTSIKAAILDQSVLAGVGNIYADEALFLAKIHPVQQVQLITDMELKKLFDSIKQVLRLGIDKGGSSVRNYINAEGKKGNYLSYTKVFKREGKPCLDCGETIIKIRVAGRGTHICPRQQILRQAGN